MLLQSSTPQSFGSSVIYLYSTTHFEKGGSRTSSSVNPSSSSCLACCMYVCGLYDWEAPAVHKQSLFSTTPRSIWYANVRKFQYIEQIFEVFENCRENLRGYEMIVCMTTPCFFMSKITRHHPIQYEGFSSVWIQVDLIILFQIF